MKRLFAHVAPRRKPRILLLVDYRGWAYDHSAQNLATELGGDFDFEIAYVTDTPKPNLRASRYDLIDVFFWGETFHQQFGFAPSKTIKTLSSHRWEDDPKFGPCTSLEMTERYLRDAATVLCTSKRLLASIAPFHARALHTPNGVNVGQFKRLTNRDGPIKFGWAGNIEDPVKGLDEILRPACNGQFNLAIAAGGLPHREMNAFYNELDVLAIASRHEGEPLTLLEAMAAGCFPVCTNVGIVPELVEHQVNGYIVNERSPAAFRTAFAWCAANTDLVREAGQSNSLLIRERRNWKTTAQFFKRAFVDALAYASCFAE